MALVVKDRVKQTTTTTGTGSVVLNGTVSGFQTFAAALSNGDTTYYAIFEPSTNEYEVGLGTWTESTATLARTTILESSNSGSAVSLTAQAEVFITQPAEKAVYLDASNNVTLTNNLTVSGDFTVSGTTTTIDTTNSVVTDSLIELSNGTTGTPANDAGIVIERGDSDNAFIGYDESADKFTVGTGSFTGASTGNLTISTGTLVANVEGNLTGNVTGNVSGSSGSTTGNAATATALQTARTIAGQSFDGTADITIAPTDLTGVTSTAAELNILDGVTSTTAELNLLDGVTATTTELNYVDGVTSAIQTQLDAKAPINNPTFTGSISHAGDLTFDVGGDLNIDVDGGDVFFKDAGSLYFSISKSGTITYLSNSSQVDGDMVFRGNDGGSPFNALTLDMSAAGAATFNAGANFGGTVTADGLTVESTGEAAALFKGYTSVTGVDSANNGEILLGNNASFQGRISYEGQTNGVLYIENSYNNNAADILFRSKSSGTAQNKLLIEGNGDISFYEDTGTTAKFFWDASLEFLGIGTTSPQSPLHINTGTDQNLRVFSASSTPTIGSLNDANSAYAALGYTGSQHEFRLGTTEVMRIDSSGNLLVGTTAPVTGLSSLTQLTVSGAEGGISINSTDTTTSDYSRLMFTKSGSTGNEGLIRYNTGDYHMSFWTDASERMRIDSSGNVGIGTTSPVVPITLQASGATSAGENTHLRINDTTNMAANVGGVIQLSGEATTGSSDQFTFATIKGIKENGTSGNYDGALTFSTRTNGVSPATERMRITSDGNVGIGTSSPSRDLYISGGGSSRADVQLSYDALGTSAADGVQLGIQAAGGYIWNFENSSLYFATNNSERMRIDSSGNLLVGKTSTNTINTVGHDLTDHGEVMHTTDGGTTMYLNRKTSDGTIIDLRKDGTQVGSIGAVSGDLWLGSSAASHAAIRFANGSMFPVSNTGGSSDGLVDIGDSLARFKDLYLSASLRLSDSTNTHKYSITATTSDALIFYDTTGNSERMRIDSSGNLLVGTTTLTTGTLGTGNTFLEIAGDSGGSGTLTISRPSNTNAEEVGGIRFANANNADDDGLDADGKLIAAISARTATSDSNAGDDAGGDLVFYTKPEAGNYAERMRIDSSGTLNFTASHNGIKIDLYGNDAHAIGTASYLNTYGPPSGGWNNGTIGHRFYSHNGTVIADIGTGGSSVNLASNFYGSVTFDDDSGINVVYSTSDTTNITGYGIISNRAAFYLRPTTDNTQTLYVGNSNSAYDWSSIELKVGDNNNVNINGNTVWHAGNDGASSGLDADLLDGNHASAFQTASTALGYVDVATSNYGTIKVDDDRSVGWAGYAIRDDWVFMSNGPGNCGIYNDTDNEWAIYITQNGSVQLRYNAATRLETTSGGAAVTGALTATGDITAYYSDERLKNFEGKIDGALDKVSKLSGYYYRENDKAKELGYENDARQVGVSAQEVEAVMPEVVKPAPVDPEYKTVQYEKLVPLLIEAIKELKEEVRQLKEDKL